MSFIGLMSIIIPFLWFQASLGYESVNSFSELPPADRYFHLYALPVGQGDSFILQCPSPGGEISLFDMGSTDYNSGGKLWSHKEVKKFLNKSFHKVRNILVTHNHLDHFSYLNNVFTSPNSVQSIQKIHISCKESDLSKEIENWVEKFKLQNKLATHNNGSPCGPNKKLCRSIDLCPNSKIKIEAKVLIANWGQQCREETNKKTLLKNVDSQVVMLKVGDVKVLLNGDFEDFTSNSEEEGPLRSLVKYYGNELVSNVYHLSHHGASNLANKNFLLNAVRPKAVFVSSNPYAKFSHPRCLVIDHLINNGSLCKPLSDPRSQFYCGPRPANNNSIGDKPDIKLQKVYSCGDESVNDEMVLRNVTNNEYAIYTTVPNENLTNLIEFKTDGIAWGFTNNFMEKFSKNRKRGRKL